MGESIKRPSRTDLIAASVELEERAQQNRWRAEAVEGEDSSLAARYRDDADVFDRVAHWLDAVRQGQV